MVLNLLSPSPKPQWFPPDSHNDPEPKGTTTYRPRLALTDEELWHLLGHNQRLGSVGLKQGSGSQSKLVTMFTEKVATLMAQQEAEQVSVNYS